MKKALYVALLFCLLIISKGFAQNKFYTGIYGGINRTTTENIYHGEQDRQFYSTFKNGQQTGFKFGYLTPSNKIGVETGIEFSWHKLLFQYTVATKTYPEFYLAYNTIQIPIHLKFNLLNPEKKIAVYSIIGAAYIFNPGSEENKIGFAENSGIQADTSYIYTHGGKPALLKINVKPDGPLGGSGKNSILYKAGLGLAYKLNNRFELEATGMFQLGKSNLFDADAEFVHYTEFRPYVSHRTVSATSKADALTFNISINYRFGKYKQKIKPN